MRRLPWVALRALRHPLALTEATTQLASIQLALTCVPFPKLLRWLAPPQPPGTNSAPVDRHYLWCIHAVSRVMFGSGGCLRRALAVSWYCRRRGIAAELRIGVARTEDGIRAHAWVDQNGAILTGGPASYVVQFAPLGRLAQTELDLFELAR